MSLFSRSLSVAVILLCQNVHTANITTYYQGVPWTTKNRIKITLKVLKTLQNEVRDIYNN